MGRPSAITMIVPGCAVSQVGMVALSVKLGACAAGSLPQAFPDPSPVVDLQVAEGDDGDERGQGPYDEVGAANSTADPCADFAAYACGPPGTRLRAARYYDWSGFRSIWRFIEELAKQKDRDDGSASGLVSDFYAVCTDAAARAQGISELRAQIDEIAGIQTFDDLARTLGRLRASGLNALVGLRFGARGNEGTWRWVTVAGLGRPELPRVLYRPPRRLEAPLREHWTRLAALAGPVSPADVDRAILVDAALADRG